MTSLPVSKKYDASTAYPLSRNPPKAPNPDPTRLCFYRFSDNTGTDHEIFVPPGKEQEIINLHANEDWDELLKFPAFSDRPPVFTVHPDCVSIPGPAGTMKSFHIPEDGGTSAARVCELVSAEDFQTLEQEFEPWDHQPNTSHLQRQEEWERGVERCANAREEEARRRDETAGRVGACR